MVILEDSLTVIGVRVSLVISGELWDSVTVWGTRLRRVIPGDPTDWGIRVSMEISEDS